MKDLVPAMEAAARKHPARVAVCDAHDERMLRAAADLAQKKLALPVLLGDPRTIRSKAKKMGVSISGIEIVDAQSPGYQDEFAGRLAELRKHKGLTREEARRLVADENYFGCMYVHCGYADAIVGSAIVPTSALMKPVLQILRKKDSLVSEVSVFSDIKNKRILFGTDGSLNISPSADDFAQMALHAAACVRRFGMEPRVALLSFSTKGSGGDTPGLQAIREAVRKARAREPGLIIDGELQMDAAVNAPAAQRKCPDSPLHGDANVLVFPDLAAANIFLHGMMQFSDMTLDFTIIEGLARPAGIVGRSSPLQAVRNIMLSCAMQANADAYP